MSDPQVIRSAAGAITVPGSVLQGIVRRSAEGDPAVRVRRRKRLEVVVDGGTARVAVELAVRHGTILPDAAEGVQERVAEALRAMCGLEAAVDVTIERLTD